MQRISITPVKTSEMQKANNLINYQELSRQLAGGSCIISKGRYPKKYDRKIKRLIRLIEAWQRWAEII
jgi:hypothetical protein